MRATGRARRRWRAAAVAAALAGHGVFLAALVASVQHERLPEGPIIEVQLARAPEADDQEEPPAATAAPPPGNPIRQRLTSPTPVAPPPPFTAPALPAAPAAPGSVAPPPSAASRVANALRAVSAGCRDPALTAEQRERCLEREGARARGEAAELAREQRRARRTDEAVRAPKPNATTLVRAPGDDPRNHTLGGPPPVMVGVTVPFGKPPKAITPIPPSTLRGDDDALRPKPRD